MKEMLKKIVKGENLTQEEASRAMDIMLEGAAEPTLVASFLTALAMKGETVDEIVGATEMMKAKGESVKPYTDSYIEFVGTGGDGVNTFNISTTSIFVCAAAGVVIAKHGNKAATSKSGASNLLEGLGVNINLEPGQVEECIKNTGIGFMNAMRFHKAMKNIAPIRSALGIRTIFNMLGPLSNPSGATAQVIGVFSREILPVFARVMRAMGVKRAMVVHGSDGMDEITVTGKTYVNEIKDGEILEYELDPEDYDIEYAKHISELRGGSGEDNAGIARAIFDGSERGAKRDIVVMNGAAGIYIGGKAKTYAEAVGIAKEMLDSGKALAKLNEFAEYTNRF